MNTNKTIKKNNIGIVSLIVMGIITLLILLTIILHIVAGVPGIVPIIFSIIGLITALVLLIVGISKNKKSCPDCQVIKQHEFRYLGSSKTGTMVRNHEDDSKSYIKVTYTHHYGAVTFCPQCHKEVIKEFTQPGGYVYKFKNGKARDLRIKPRYVNTVKKEDQPHA